jgi:PPOX class probable FMN-dependent enzyme
VTQDLFAGAFTTDEQLREIYEPPSGLAAVKEIDHLDAAARSFIACSSLLFLASADGQGRCDVTPRGGPAGFVHVADEHQLVIPDATGNRRIDTWHNVLSTGRIGVIFLIPGRSQTLRVNGRAAITARPDILGRLTPVGKAPRMALVVQAEEVFTHCPKAFVRSGAWQPEKWLDAAAQPGEAEMLHSHVNDPSITLEDVARSQRESLLHRLA